MSLGTHKDCGGDVVLVETSGAFSQAALWETQSEVFSCDKCQLRFYNKDQLQASLEPVLFLRWLTNKATGERHLALVTDPQSGAKYEP